MAQNKNYHMIRYGVAEGEIKFGHIHTDNVISACMLRSGFSYKHYITLDGPGGEDFRKHSTTCRSPGSFQVMAGEGVPDEQPGIFLDAENGDIVIRAANGRVRIEAIDVDIRAQWCLMVTEVTSFLITILSLNGQVIDMKAETAKFFSEKSCEISGTTVTNIYGGFIDMADGATSIKGSKNPVSGVLGTAWEIRNKINAFVA